MLWWRKRNEGFEWRDYVRTTILVRREQRRQKIKDVQAAAAAQVKDAGRKGLDAGISGARTAGTGVWYGLTTAGKAMASGAKRSAQALATGSVAAARAIGSGAARVGSATASGIAKATSAIASPLAPTLEPVAEFAGRPRMNLALKAIAVLCAFGAAYRAWTFGFDSDALVVAIISGVAASMVIMASLAGPRDGSRFAFLRHLRDYELNLPGQLRISADTAVYGVLAACAVAGLGALAYSYAPPLAQFATPARTSAPVTTGALPDSDPSKLEGRATALAGDTLRIGNKRITLDNVEAPEVTQTCVRNGKPWRCGAAARDALASLVRNRRVTCEILSEDASSTRARCYSGPADIAEALVSKGHVFALGGFWSKYASVQDRAQNEKLGLWSGEADRPQDFRDKQWEEAKKTAPEGCPIKGAIRSGSRTYVLPWSSAYGDTRVRESRGERWFCSESEAESAGWSRGS